MAEADKRYKHMSGYLAYYTVESRHMLLHLLQPWQAQFLYKGSDYFGTVYSEILH